MAEAATGISGPLYRKKIDRRLSDAVVPSRIWGFEKEKRTARGVRVADFLDWIRTLEETARGF